ncbi:MAG: hypothetical protein H6651_18835 [Ardenticatenales bacterium]|nr:hypothetical protein [Ardenticatenales bacterium]
MGSGGGSREGGATVAPAELDLVEQAIWRTVVYSDIYDYPLTLSELHRYLEGAALSQTALAQRLAESQRLATQIGSDGHYFFLPGQDKQVQVRLDRSQEAGRLRALARSYGLWLAHLPFVRLVALTGSLAMANVSQGADIDYLIVTAPGRVWLARALVIAVVRWAAWRGAPLCPNFILSEDALHFERQNLYVAREIAQMIPLSGMAMYRRLRAENQWTERYLPNAVGPPAGTHPPAMPQWRLTRLAEWLLSGRLGDRLDEWERGRKVRKFRRQHPNWSEAAFSRDFCKGHFDAHESEALSTYDVRVSRREG